MTRKVSWDMDMRGRENLWSGRTLMGRLGMPSHAGGARRNMAKVPNNAKQGRPIKTAVRSSTAHLDELIEEATVDCYNESEEITGIFTMLEENLTVPFATKLLGLEVTVERVDLNKAGEIVAVCRRGRERLRVPIIDLPLPEVKPKGEEWIDTYRRWAQWK